MRDTCLRGNASFGPRGWPFTDGRLCSSKTSTHQIYLSSRVKLKNYSKRFKTSMPMGRSNCRGHPCKPDLLDSSHRRAFEIKNKHRIPVEATAGFHDQWPQWASAKPLQLPLSVASPANGLTSLSYIKGYKRGFPAIRLCHMTKKRGTLLAKRICNMRKNCNVSNF